MHRTISMAVFSLLIVVLLLPGLPVQSAPRAAPVATQPHPNFGLNTNIASRHPVYETLQAPADTTRDLGAGWAREDFQFFRINPEPGVFDWNWHDQMVDLFAERGISVIGLLNGPSPGWATPGFDGASSFFAPDPTLFAAFAGAVAERYRGKINYWQIWNEPDNGEGLYWQPKPNMAEYAALLKASYQAIKQANPSAQVLAGSMVSPQPATQSLQALYDHGAWNSFDIISVHPYTDPEGPEEGQIDIAGVGTVRGLAETLGAKPIWATEFGWSTGPSGRIRGQGVPVDESTQANYLIRGSVLLRASGVEHVFWYCLKDTEEANGHPHNLYGLLKFDGTKADYTPQYHKPSYLAYKVMTEQLLGTSSAAPLDLSPEVNLLNFEQFSGWRRGDEPNGDMTQSSEQAHTGQFSGRLSYNFSTPGNDYVVFLAPSPIPIAGNPSKLGVWIYGDGSGFPVKVWLRDSEGETLQYRLGTVGSGTWTFVSTPLSQSVGADDVVRNRRNGQLDFPISLEAIVLDDDPNETVRSGVIYLDDLTAALGSESYAVRFPKDGSNEVVDVIWAPQSAQVNIPTDSRQAERVRAWGDTTTETPTNGQFSLTVGPDPIFLTHVPRTGPAAPPPPPVDTNPPASVPLPPEDGEKECFSTTGQCVSGLLREYWRANGELPVFGYPITPYQTQQIEGLQLSVQWFERNRLERHMEESADSPYHIQIGLLGLERLTQLGRDPFAEDREDGPGEGCLWFEETGHNVCDQATGVGFKTYWESHGLTDPRLNMSDYERSLSLFGLPLTEAQWETNEADGKSYLTQWFQRARFEWHPENDAANRVLLGLLGNEMLAADKE